MTTMFDVYAIKLSEINIPQIVETVKLSGWNLDHLQDSLEYHAEYGCDTMLFMKLFKDNSEIATFSDESSDPNVDDSYRLTDQLDPKFGIFYKIEKI